MYFPISSIEPTYHCFHQTFQRFINPTSVWANVPCKFTYGELLLLSSSSLLLLPISLLITPPSPSSYSDSAPSSPSSPSSLSPLLLSRYRSDVDTRRVRATAREEREPLQRRKRSKISQKNWYHNYLSCITMI